MSRVGLLETGLGVALVVDNDERQVLWTLHRNGRKRAQSHQHLAVARGDQHASRWLRLRQSQADYRGAAHGAPQVEIEGMIAGGGKIVCGRSQSRDHQQVSAICDQSAHHRPTLENGCSRHLNTFVPMTRCAMSTAAARSLLKAIRAAACTVSTASAAWSIRCTSTPACSRMGSVPFPMGICQGLNSPHSPRIVTSISSGNRQTVESESMLMQLPTPLLCISSTPRSPPSQAPASMAMPSSSVVSITDFIAGLARQRSLRRVWPASGTS